MALRPVDLQNIINTSIEVAKITQTRNDTPNMHQSQFAIQFQREAERKSEQVQKSKNTEEDSTRIKEESKRRNRESRERKENKKKKENNETILDAKREKRHIDIKI